MGLKKIGAALGLAATAACGGMQATGPTPTYDGPIPMDQTVVARRTLAAHESAQVGDVTGAGGAWVSVSANWTLAANDIDIYVTTSDCFEIPSALSVDSCLTVAQAASPSAKPEQVTFQASAGLSYKVFAANRGSEADTVTLAITVH